MTLFKKGTIEILDAKLVSNKDRKLVEEVRKEFPVEEPRHKLWDICKCRECKEYRAILHFRDEISKFVIQKTRASAEKEFMKSAFTGKILGVGRRQECADLIARVEKLTTRTTLGLDVVWVNRKEVLAEIKKEKK